MTFPTILNVKYRGKINLANIPDIEKFNYLKVVGYLNGEGKIKYIDLDKIPTENTVVQS